MDHDTLQELKTLTTNLVNLTASIEDDSQLDDDQWYKAEALINKFQADLLAILSPRT